MKQFIKKNLVGVVRFMITIFGEGWRRKVSLILREAMSRHGFDEVIKVIETKRGRVRFYCLDSLPLWRAETLLTKEPETIEWIDSMEDGDVLFDIGANVGIYTIYAGIKKSVKVKAFEPLAANYFLINRNIEENNLFENVQAFCLALNDKDMLGSFHVQNTGFGSAVSSFDVPIDHNGDQFEAKFEQGMVGMTLDNFVEKFEPDFPTHIKIDVDGIEDKIIKGALKTLSDARVKSVSIELDEKRPEYTNAIITDIESVGFSLTSKRHSPMFDKTQYSNIFNYRFDRAV
ncbi:FkbM family methyltransferase [Terasakiella sp. A23]|uniref:FkbM family methyltransferase n=1 Tax=Terasakiella sp. FCG-A23 TaxID=3080561 RepID=UPI002955D9F4|nr:FkbM family methyltransferase [Terasakiella sp. A23]MDV7340812.1 FkbM family methyltransferase [Terasakiella sp. A23]